MSDNQRDNFFENKRVFEIREYLKLEQKGFAEAIGTHQTSISKIEANTISLSRKIKVKICNTFHINPDFFVVETDAPMFLEGKEKEARQVAQPFLPKKSPGRSTNTESGRLLEIQAIRIEKLTSELELTKELLKSKEEIFHSREEILKSKDDLILILKEQLEQANTNYEKLFKEISELKDLLNERDGGTDDPNGIHPVKSSG